VFLVVLPTFSRECCPVLDRRDALSLLGGKGVQIGTINSQLFVDCMDESLACSLI
jgi:hypothetical protein